MSNTELYDDVYRLVKWTTGGDIIRHTDWNLLLEIKKVSLFSPVIISSKSYIVTLFVRPSICNQFLVAIAALYIQMQVMLLLMLLMLYTPFCYLELVKKVL